MTTTALTAVVTVIWLLLMRSRNKETARLLRLRRAQLSEAIMDEDDAEARGRGQVTKSTGLGGSTELAHLSELRERQTYSRNV